MGDWRIYTPVGPQTFQGTSGLVGSNRIQTVCPPQQRLSKRRPWPCIWRSTLDRRLHTPRYIDSSDGFRTSSVVTVSDTENLRFR